MRASSDVGRFWHMLGDSQKALGNSTGTCWMIEKVSR